MPALYSSCRKAPWLGVELCVHFPFPTLGFYLVCEGPIHAVTVSVAHTHREKWRRRGGKNRQMQRGESGEGERNVCPPRTVVSRFKVT